MLRNLFRGLTTIMQTALLKGIKDRQLDTYYQTEETITKTTKAQMMEWIKDPQKGTEPLDKLRLFIIWFLSTTEEVSRTDVDNFSTALDAAGADTTCLAYVRKVREVNRMTMMSSTTSAAPTTQTNSTSDQLFKGFSSLSSRFASGLKEAGIGANIENLISGVKNFLPQNKDLTLTKIVESIVDPTNASSAALSRTESYLYFDPRSANARGTVPPASAVRAGQSAGGAAPKGIEASFGQLRRGFSEAIVFTVGGGSVDEYGNLQEWVARANGVGGAGAAAASGAQKRRIVYGSTEIVNAEDFIKLELARLGKEV